jgi:hypothetical protein
VDGEVMPLLHVSQLASLLDLPRPEGADTVPVAYDTVAILEDWLALVPQAPFELLLAPTPSRGRSIRNLTVNVFHPFELLPGAWLDGRFDWFTGEADERREEPLTSVPEIVDYGRDILDRWQLFLLEHEDALAERDPMIGSNRNDAPFSVLLQSQRWHAAFHHRQVVDVLTRAAVPIGAPLQVEALGGLDLPPELY